MYMFYYFVRIAREIFGRRKLQRILIIGALLIGLYFVFSRLGAFAYTGLEGNDDYTDPNNSIYKYYDSYLDDLAVRLMSSSSDDAEDLIDRLTYDRNYSFIIIYGQQNEDQNNTFQYMQVLLFASNTAFSDSTYANNWHNMNCQICYARPTLVYTFNNNICTRSNGNDNYYFPRMLVNRFNMNLINVLSQLNDTDTQSLVGAINNQTSQIQNQTTQIQNQTSAIGYQTDVLQETQDFVTDDSIDESEMSVDTSQTAIDDNTGIDNFFTTFLGSVQSTIENYAENDVTTISIPMPHNIPDLVLRSDLLSRYIPNGPLKTLITIFWTYIFGGYLVVYIYRMIKWLTSGRVFDEGGVADFIWYLDTNNEIIKGYMM